MLIFTKTIMFLFRQVISVRIVKANTAFAVVIDNDSETYSSTNPMLISVFKIVLAFPMAHPQKRLALVILIFFDFLVMAFQPLFVPPQSFTNLLKLFLSILYLSQVSIKCLLSMTDLGVVDHLTILLCLMTVLSYPKMIDLAITLVNLSLKHQMDSSFKDLQAMTLLDLE